MTHAFLPPPSPFERDPFERFLVDLGTDLYGPRQRDVLRDPDDADLFLLDDVWGEAGERGETDVLDGAPGAAVGSPPDATDPDVAAALVDAVGGQLLADGQSGLAVLLCGGTGEAIAPVLIDGAPRPHESDGWAECVAALAGGLSRLPVPAVVAGIVSPGPSTRPDDGQRRVHQQLLDHFGQAGIDLLSTWLLTDGGVALLPVRPHLRLV